MPFAETPTGPLHYELCDTVPPWVDGTETIVFHHGVAADLHLWARWLPGLVGRYRLLRLDMRGYGQSVRPQAGFDWTFDVLMDDLTAVVDAAGIERFHLVGESLGGTMAIAYALREPQRLLSLTLSNTAARGGLIKNVEGWRDLAHREGQKAWARQMMQWRFHPGALDPAIHAWFLALHESCDLETTLQLAEMLLAADLTPQLKNVRVPTLLLSPDGSPFIKLDLMTEMRAAIPDAELQVFAHARHGLPVSHGPACSTVLQAFLARRSR